VTFGLRRGQVKPQVSQVKPQVSQEQPSDG